MISTSSSVRLSIAALRALPSREVGEILASRHIAKGVGVSDHALSLDDRLEAAQEGVADAPPLQLLGECRGRHLAELRLELVGEGDRTRRLCLGR
jgi:hypothetical protein